MLDGSFEQGDHVAGLVVQAVGELLVVSNEVGHVDVAVVLFGEDVFSDLISGWTLSELRQRHDASQHTCIGRHFGC